MAIRGVEHLVRRDRGMGCAGTIGIGWAHLFARGGHRVKLTDAAPGRLAAGAERLAETFDQLVAEDSAHRAYGGVALPNDASVALHRKLGFEHVGSYHEVGFKFDKFWDVDWFEKDLTGQ